MIRSIEPVVMVPTKLIGLFMVHMLRYMHVSDIFGFCPVYLAGTAIIEVLDLGLI